MQPVVGSTSSMGEIWRWKIPSIGKSLLAVIAPHLSITGAPLSLIHNGYWQPQQKCLEHWPNGGNHVVPDSLHGWHQVAKKSTKTSWSLDITSLNVSITIFCKIMLFSFLLSYNTALQMLKSRRIQ